MLDSWERKPGHDISNVRREVNANSGRVKVIYRLRLFYLKYCMVLWCCVADILGAVFKVAQG